MRLTVDLRFDAAGEHDVGDGERVLGFHRLAAAAKSPRELISLLRDQPWEEVRVVRDRLPLSGVQGVVLVLVGLVRTRRFVLGGRATGRTLFVIRALGEAAVAAPRELLRAARGGRRIRRSAARVRSLPALKGTPRTVAYMRVDPTLLWHGSYVGGAATHTTGVIRGLLDNGLEVTVYAPQRPDGVTGAVYEHVPVTRVHHLVRGLTYADYSVELVGAADRRPVDFVYQRHQLGADAGLELADRLGVPFVLEFNGSEIWVEQHWGSGSLRMHNRLEALERRNVLDASLVVVVSEPLKDQLAVYGVPDERILVNPNGTDVDRLAQFRDRTPADWRAQGELPEAPTIGFIGTFGLWHGVKVIPEIADELHRLSPEARWIVIGDGELRAEVRADLEERGLGDVVMMPGVVPHDEALALLAACDVCVSPHVPNPDGSPFFGSPTKLFEYMGLAKPIVASDLDQIGEVIEHARTGLLVPPGDARATAEAVDRLLRDDALRARLGSAALAEAVERYSWTAHTRRILDALASQTR